MKNKYYLLSDFDNGGGVATQVQYIAKFYNSFKEVYKKDYLRLIFNKPFLPKSIIATSFKGIAIGLIIKIFNKKSKLIYIAYFDRILDPKVRGFLIANILKIVLYHCDLIIPFDQITFNKLSKYNYSFSKLIIGIACDSHKVTKKNRELGTITKVLWVGRLVEFKVIALTKLIENILTFKDVKLTIIGEGPLQDKLHKKYKSLENIDFLGKLSIKEIIDVANQSDISIGMATTLLTLFNCSSVSIASFAYSENLYLPKDCSDITYSEPRDRNPINLENLISEIKSNGKKEFLNIQYKLYDQIINNFDKNFINIIKEIEIVENKNNFIYRLFIAFFILNLLFLAEINRKLNKKPIL